MRSCCSLFALLLSLLFVGLAQGLSKKAWKLQQEESSNNGIMGSSNPESDEEDFIEETTTKDPFQAFFDEEEITTTTEDPFFSFDESESFFDSLLPPCESLFEEDRMPGSNCDNSTSAAAPEIRWNDPVFERLIAQVWSDLQYKLNHESQLYGVTLDPFDVDAKLPQPIDIEQAGSGYSAKVQMHDIKMYGLSGINLNRVEVTRNENLTDFHVRVVFGFDELEINGTYALKGYVGWWTLDSKGEQDFSIKMINATLAYEMKANMVKPDDWSTHKKCTSSSMNEMTTDSVLIDEIRIPLKYDDVDFVFNNLGSFANTVVNGVGIFFLQTQEDTLVGAIRKAIKKNVNSLIC